MTDIQDHQRATQWPIHAVQIFAAEHADEYYEVGKHGIVAIKWGETCGQMAMLKTVVVYREDGRISEHPFANVLSVYYATLGEKTDG